MFQTKIVTSVNRKNLGIPLRPARLANTAGTWEALCLDQFGFDIDCTTIAFPQPGVTVDVRFK